MTSEAPESVYGRRRAEFGVLRDRYARRSDRNGNLSLALFAGALACLVAALWRGGPLLYGAVVLLTPAFVASLAFHDRVKRRLRRYTELCKINDEALRRLGREWSVLPAPCPVHAGEPLDTVIPGLVYPALDASSAADLDLIGHASLEHLLGTPNTPIGQTTLRQWILQAAAPETVRARQAATDELASLIDFRDEVCLRGRLMGPAEAQKDYERFLEWAESGGWLNRRPWLIWLARLLPLLALGLAVAQWRGLPLGGAAYPALGAVLLANIALTLTYGQAASRLVEQVAGRQGVFGAYAEMFGLIAGQQFAAPGLRGLQARLSAGPVSAERQMRRLGRLMPLADIRHAMFFILVECATLWSFHVLWLFERWQRAAGKNVRGWLETLGETEALIALAGLRHGHPGWAFPEVVAGDAPVFAAKNLAHPLLPPVRAVGNDVRVGPPGTFLLVTGSNMSGKSTLLRAIGVNAVLAQMGGPVCAAEMRLPPLAVASSMRVQDSLEQGVSSYMAELRRLKALVDLADRQRGQGERPVLYLLDEILQGTNTAERQIAARRVIAHLVSSGAIGAVSTHDLTLAAAPELAQVSKPVYFTEKFTRETTGPAMSFDYRLRDGIATSTNALKLMELIGLAAEAE